MDGQRARVAMVRGVGGIWFATGAIADIALSISVTLHLDYIVVCS